MGWWTCLAAAAAVFLAGAAQGGPGAEFDWFQYQGRDEVFEAPLRPGHYRNPILAGFYPDPSVVRVGEDYYLVTSSFAYFPGLPVFHSRDLVHWRQLGHALSSRSQLRFENGQGISRGIFAPTIRYHDGLFYIITTDVDGIGNFFVTAKDPAGPWSEPVVLPEIEGIDPDLFFDDDGRAWIAHNGAPQGGQRYEGHRAIWLWEFDAARRRVVAASGRVIVDGGVDIASQPIWIEGPHLFRHEGWYYLVCAEGGTGEGHSEVVFRARTLDAPFQPWSGNPILTQRDLDPDRPHPVTSTGHADLVQTGDGDWWAVFLGVRPYGDGHHNTGRETFLLPVEWRDGWPVILDAGKPVPYQAPRPVIGDDTGGTAPRTGNFTWRDEFESPPLKHEWVRVRTSAQTWFDLAAGSGRIRIEALPVRLGDPSQPAYLGRRQQHQDYAASTRLLLPLEAGVSAGLAAFQGSDFNYFLGVRNEGGFHRVFLEQVSDGQVRVLEQVRMETAADHVVLGLEMKRAAVDFYFATAPTDLVWVARDVDARILSTRVAGGFVGATVGIHARDEPARDAAEGSAFGRYSLPP